MQAIPTSRVHTPDGVAYIAHHRDRVIFVERARYADTYELTGDWEVAVSRKGVTDIPGARDTMVREHFETKTYAVNWAEAWIYYYGDVQP